MEDPHMPVHCSARIPAYRHHKPTGLAVVTLNGRDLYLGQWNTNDSRSEYDRLISEWMANGRRLPGHESQLTLTELIASYWRHAKSYYGHNRRSSGHLDNIRLALRLLREAYGPTIAAEFGPRSLKALRETLVDRNYSRGYVNKLIDLIRQMFRWSASEELIPVAVLQGLQTVAGLRRGHSNARETAPIRPVDDPTVEATLPYLPPIVADMVRLQRLTGCRPAEVCILRPCDLDCANSPWQYRPQVHKTQYFGRERVILIGPRAQKLLRPYLQRDNSRHCFVPAEGESRRHAARREHRRTPMTPSQSKRRPKLNRKRAPGECYTTDTYRRAIERACDQAFPPPEGLSDEERKLWKKRRRWAPNRLRHTAATQIRKQYGLEAAQVTLGHASADVSQIYAERDLTLAARVMREVG